jgi:hypothetical protein
MFVERLYVAARTDCTQIHRHAPGAHGKFFRRVHEFSAKAFALLRRIYAEQPQIHPVLAFFKVDAADKTVLYFEKQKFAGAEIFQRAGVVEAVAADERALDFKCGVDEPRKSAGVRNLRVANRNCGSLLLSRKNRTARKFCG